MHLPPRHHAAELGRDLGQLEPDDEAREMMGMGADVAEHQRCAAQLGHEAPVGGRLAVGLGRPGEIALDVLHMQLADRPELAALHHGAGVAHHRIAGVIVGQAEYQAAASFTRRTRSSASSRFVANGLSQITSRPLASASRAIE